MFVLIGPGPKTLGKFGFLQIGSPFVASLGVPFALVTSWKQGAPSSSVVTVVSFCSNAKCGLTRVATLVG